MGGKRGFAVLLVVVLVVGVSGFATAPGGIGGPTMAVSSGDSAVASGSFADAGAVDAAERLDGPDDTIRAKLRPRTKAAASALRNDLSIGYDFGDVFTATVTGSRYEELEADPDVEVAPVQRVRLAQSSGVTVSWYEPTEGDTLEGTIDVTVEADADAGVETVTWQVDGGETRSTDRVYWSEYYRASWNTTGVDDGTHQLTAEVEADDGTTESTTVQVTVDNVNESPSVQWTEPTAGASVDGSVPLRIAASDTDGTVQSVEWQVDGGAARSATYNDSTDRWEATWDASGATAGTHQLTARAVDDGGSESSATISVDVAATTDDETTDDETTDDETTDDETTDDETTDDGTTDDGTTDDGTTDDGTSNDTNEAPTVDWQSPTDGDQVDGETALSIAASDTDGSVEAVQWRVDDGTPREATYDSSTDRWTATWNASRASAGTHDLTAASTDDAGATTTATIAVDVADSSDGTEDGTSNDTNEAPTVTWQSPTDGDQVDGETALSIAASDPDGTVEEVGWRVDDGSVRSASYNATTDRWEATWDASTAEAGTHALSARAVDDNGSTAGDAIEVNVESAGEPPTVWWQSPLDGDELEGTVRLQLDASDTGGTVEVVYWAVDGGDQRQATYNSTSDYWEATWDAEAAGGGDHELRAAAVDDGGHTSSPTRIDVTVDDTNDGPTVSWQSPQDEVTVDGTVDVRIAASDPDGEVDRVAWQVDDRQPTAAQPDPTSSDWVGTWDASALEDGEYTLRTRAVDDDGASANATITVTVDSENEAPTVSFEAPDDGATVSGEIEVRIRASDADGSIDRLAWAVDDADPQPASATGSGVWTATLDSTTLADGEHVLHAGAKDDEGAKSATTVTIDVDNGGGEPTVSWAWPADGETVGQESVRIRLDAEAPGGSIAQVRWQVEGGEPQSATYDETSGYWEATWDASDTSAGEHRLRARVLSEAGESADAAITVSVDEADEAEREETERADDAEATADSSMATPPEPTPYGVRQVYGERTLERTSGGDGVDVAVVDTGVDTDHPDLQGSIAACVDLLGSGTCDDGNGHGTHLSGIAVADGGDGDGLYGVAPGADLHVYKAVDAEGVGHADDVAAAIHRAAENDVEVVILGLQTEAGGSLVQRAMREHEDDVIFVAAAGNDGPTAGTLASPGDSDAAIAVGAIDHQGRVLDTASRGADAGFCDCPDRAELVAAGDAVVSTWPGGGYSELSGTSVATPHVAGLAAHVWASGAADVDGDGTVTPAEVREYLREGTMDVTDGEGAGEGYDPASGYGLPILD